MSETEAEEDVECKVCQNDVLESENGMYCEGECQSWYHTSCVGISGSKYKKITSDITKIFIWMCPACKAKLKTLMQQHKQNKQLLEKVINIDTKILDLEKTIQSQNTSQATYAQVMISASKEHQRLPENLPNILIKPKKTQSGQQTLLDVEEKIKPEQIGARVKSKRELSNGNIVLKFPSVADMKKVKSEANKALKDKYEIVETSLRNPKIKIPGITLNYSKEDFETQLRKQNSIFMDDEHFKITYIKNIEHKSTKTLYAECSPKLFHSLMASKRVYLGWQRYVVYKDMSVLKCYKCQLYHHKGNDCKNRIACGKCAGEHDIKQCQSETKECVNCKISNEKYGTEHNIAHKAGEWSCPSFKYFLEIARSRINYG